MADLFHTQTIILTLLYELALGNSIAYHLVSTRRKRGQVAL